MSYWIYLVDENDETIDTDTLSEEGGTCVLGGTTKAELNVTWNYAKHFNFRGLDNMVANEAAPILIKKINDLGNNQDPDYWKPTEGNVKRTLCKLLRFAEYAINNNINAKFIVH